jgi:rhamnosyltransferase
MNNNRLGIFVFFDHDGVVDSYVSYLLDSMMPNLKEIFIVVNGSIHLEGMRRLSKYTDNIIVRENTGYDVSAWKEAVLRHIDKSHLRSFDEVVFFNDTFYGPLYPFGVVFEEMSGRDVDFWGLTAHPEANDPSGRSVYGFIPKFIQSFFYVFRQSVTESDDFYSYWTDIPSPGAIGYDEAVHLHEVVFAKKFQGKGYRWDAYIDNAELCDCREHSICYNTFMPFGMIKERKMPVIRRKVLNFDYCNSIRHTGLEEPAQVLEYVKKETDYPVDLIWDNLLRLYDISDLKTSLHLNYIPDDDADVYVSSRKSAVIMHLYYTDNLESVGPYVTAVPDDVDLIITTVSDEKMGIISEFLKSLGAQRAEVRVTENRGRDMAALLVCCADIFLKYDYLCFTHDKKTSRGAGPMTIGRSFQHIVMENTLKSKAFVHNVIRTFDENPRLGILSVPSPIHSLYFGSIGQEWTSNFEGAKKLLESFGLKIKLSPEKAPFALGNAFWCRTDALSRLVGKPWIYTDFPDEPLPVDGCISHVLERVMIYFAQDKGYYSGWVMTPDYASLEISNLNRMFSEVVRIQQNKTPENLAYSFSDFIEREKRLTYSFNGSIAKALRCLVQRRIKKMTKQMVKAVKRRIYWIKRKIG